jgi:hypothetical protein
MDPTTVITAGSLPGGGVPPLGGGVPPLLGGLVLVDAELPPPPHPTREIEKAAIANMAAIFMPVRVIVSYSYQ